jgi:hypothetical protein
MALNYQGMLLLGRCITMNYSIYGDYSCIYITYIAVSMVLYSVLGLKLTCSPAVHKKSSSITQQAPSITVHVIDRTAL